MKMPEKMEKMEKIKKWKKWKKSKNGKNLKNGKNGKSSKVESKNSNFKLRRYSKKHYIVERNDAGTFGQANIQPAALAP
jgi:hypothetical protein